MYACLVLLLYNRPLCDTTPDAVTVLPIPEKVWQLNYLRAVAFQPSGGLPSIILAPEDFPGPASLQVASADAQVSHLSIVGCVQQGQAIACLQCSQDDSTDDLPIRPLTRPSIRATAGTQGGGWMAKAHNLFWTLLDALPHILCCCWLVRVPYIAAICRFKAYCA